MNGLPRSQKLRKTKKDQELVEDDPSASAHATTEVAKPLLTTVEMLLRLSNHLNEKSWQGNLRGCFCSAWRIFRRPTFLSSSTISFRRLFLAQGTLAVPAQRMPARDTFRYTRFVSS
jgi:hypothetical protein